MNKGPLLWTNRSVLALASGADPIQVVTDRARTLAMEAIQRGWSGPPYDPFTLAEFLKVSVVARHDIPEARTVPSRAGYLIEFNPNRPRARVKYSICHELAHTLFPDCGERIRNRVTHAEMKGDEWQLEMLCNLGAAELLMPIGSVPSLSAGKVNLDAILEARKQHEVSVEAVLLRAIRLTSDQVCAFSSSYQNAKGGSGYFIEYALGSRTWQIPLRAGQIVPHDSVIADCTAIGFTAKGSEIWDQVGVMRVECVGVPPYPKETRPRVVGVLRPHKQAPVRIADITYVVGDARHPRGGGPKILTQIVNDSAFTWGGGFSLALRSAWPDAQKEFRAWAERERRNLRLGNLHFTEVAPNLALGSMIAQHGYGQSPTPRIRYSALKSSLDQLSRLALERSASVHMPRIGTGQAGGSWGVISELIRDLVCSRGIPVTVYDQPGPAKLSHPQSKLEFAN